MRIKIRYASTSKILIFDEKAETLESLTAKIVQKFSLNNDEKDYCLMLIDTKSSESDLCQIEDVNEIMQDDWVDLLPLLKKESSLNF